MPGRTLIALTMLLALFGMGACSKVPRPSDQPSEIPDPQPHPTAHIAPNVETLLDAALADPYAYDKLGELCDEVGHRLTGSPAWRGPSPGPSYPCTRPDSTACGPNRSPSPTGPAATNGPAAPPRWNSTWTMSGLGLSDGTGPDGIEAEVMAVGELRRTGSPRRRGRRQDRAVRHALGGLRQRASTAWTEPAPPPGTAPSPSWSVRSPA